MMKLLPDFPDNIVGIAASGEVEANDYETVLIPAVESAVQRHGRIRLLYQLGPGFIRFTPGAMWDDARVGLAHPKSWERFAIVTDVAWVTHAAGMFKFLIPAVVKVFSLDEQSEAEKWIAA